MTRPVSVSDGVLRGCQRSTADAARLGKDGLPIGLPLRQRSTIAAEYQIEKGQAQIGRGCLGLGVERRPSGERAIGEDAVRTIAKYRQQLGRVGHRVVDRQAIIRS